MTRSFLSASLAVFVALLTGCDGYTYKGMGGRQALARANGMPLQEAYSFYLQTYEGVHPPMLDVAETFRRFGAQGSSYVASKALHTSDPREFEADLRALLVLDYHCPDGLTKALVNKRGKLGSEVSVAQECGSAA